MVNEDGFILLAAAQIVDSQSGRNPMNIDSMVQKTIETFKKMRAELMKPENV